MRRYKVIGWYINDPHDENLIPYARVVFVQAENRSMAFDDGETKLRNQPNPPRGELINWYVQEVKNESL